MHNNDNEFYIDPEAKPSLPLNKILDANGNPYYIGKLQFPGTMDFELGASFFIFVSEDGYEELQISPINPNRRTKTHRGSFTMSDGRFSIKLHPMRDRNDRIYYVGEATGLNKLDLTKGIFFTIFLSKPGHEEVQISRLNHRRRFRDEEDIREIEVEAIRNSWPKFDEGEVS